MRFIVTLFVRFVSVILLGEDENWLVEGNSEPSHVIISHIACTHTHKHEKRKREVHSHNDKKNYNNYNKRTKYRKKKGKV